MFVCLCLCVWERVCVITHIHNKTSLLVVHLTRRKEVPTFPSDSPAALLTFLFLVELFFYFFFFFFAMSRKRPWEWESERKRKKERERERIWNSWSGSLQRGTPPLCFLLSRNGKFALIAVDGDDQLSKTQNLFQMW